MRCWWCVIKHLDAGFGIDAHLLLLPQNVEFTLEALQHDMLAGHLAWRSTDMISAMGHGTCIKVTHGH